MAGLFLSVLLLGTFFLSRLIPASPPHPDFGDLDLDIEPFILPCNQNFTDSCSPPLQQHQPHEQRFTLPNGLEVFLINDPSSKLSKVAARVNAGSLHEPDDFPGLAHLLEHVVFTSTDLITCEKTFAEVK